MNHVAVCQNLVPLLNIKIAAKWMFIPLKMVLIGIDPYPCDTILLPERRPGLLVSNLGPYGKTHRPGWKGAENFGASWRWPVLAMALDRHIVELKWS